MPPTPRIINVNDGDRYLIIRIYSHYCYYYHYYYCLQKGLTLHSKVVVSIAYHYCYDDCYYYPC